MGIALEVVTGYASPASTTGGTYVPFTANAPQSYAIRQANGVPAANMLAPWAEFEAAGFLQIKSPRMHDTTIGTTFSVQADSAAFSGIPLEALDYDEPVYSTDILTVNFTNASSQTATTDYAMGVPFWYPDLPGVQANLLTWQQIMALNNVPNKVGDHYVSWVAPTTAGTAGQIGTGVAINSVNDQFRANHSYALLGYLPQDPVCSVLVQGVDTGNLYLGGPGTLDVRQTRNFFVDMSLAQGLPTIPVIQANNKGNTFVSVQGVQTTSTATPVGLVWMDLGILNTPVAA